MTRLFVYGTLRSGGSAGHLLATPAVRRLPGTLIGYALYGRTSLYPFVAPHPDCEVVGEVVVVEPENADEVMAELDRCEGPEYQRTVASVLVGGMTVSAQLWEAVETVRLSEDQRIASGDWFDR